MCKTAFALQDSWVLYCGNQFFFSFNRIYFSNLFLLFHVYHFGHILFHLRFWVSVFSGCLNSHLMSGCEGSEHMAAHGALLSESLLWNGVITWYLPAWNLKESVFSKTHLQLWHCHFKVVIERKHVSGENCCFSSVSTIFSAQSKPSVEFWVTKQVPPGGDLLPSTWFN